MKGFPVRSAYEHHSSSLAPGEMPKTGKDARFRAPSRHQHIHKDGLSPSFQH